MTKHCRDCGLDKPVTDFYRNRRLMDGYARYCKPCMQRRQAASRMAHGVNPREVIVEPPGQKRCADCKEMKALAEFPPHRKGRHGRHSYCLTCNNRRSRESRQRLHGGSRHYHLVRRYGITAEEFDRMLVDQGYVCMICGRADPEHVDHDHRTGKVRGILCFNCNGGLGQFRDRPDLLANAIQYLKGGTWEVIMDASAVCRLYPDARPAHPLSST